MKMNDVHKIREFNRFYTRIIGLLNKYLLDSHYSLPEVRVLYEIHSNENIMPKEIAELLGMDKSYLSRILLSFDKKGLITRRVTKLDGRAQVISLTPKGEKEFLKVNLSSENQATELLSKLTKQQRQELIRHMDDIQVILSKINIKK